MEETAPNNTTVQQPSVDPAPVQDPNAGVVTGTVPQNQDKTDAMTYPLGSQNIQPQAPEVEEDHRSILDRIMGLFSKGKKPDQPHQPQAPQIPSTPSNPSV